MLNNGYEGEFMVLSTIFICVTFILLLKVLLSDSEFESYNYKKYF